LPFPSSTGEILPVRAAAATLLVLTMLQGASSPEPWRVMPAADDAPRVAQLASSAAGLFLRLVNERLKGRIDPRSVSYVAPAGILLEDTVLSSESGKPVARVKRALAQVSIRALFSGEILISRIELDEPRLLLEIEADGGLNLLKALSPRKPPDEDAPPTETEFRIGDIVVNRGGFRFSDGESVTIVLDDIEAHASVDVNLGNKTAVVLVDDVAIDSGSVKLPDLDVPLRRLSAERIRVLTDKVEVQNVRGLALDGVGGKSARLTVNGRIDVKEPGDLRLDGVIDADAGVWPERLEALPFVTPSIRGRVAINGPFKAPVIDIDGTVGSTTISGYAVDSGTVAVRITTDQVTLKEGTVLKVGRGAVVATGTVFLPGQGRDDAILDLKTVVTGLPLGVALAPAELDTTLRGTVAGNLKITGPAGQKTALLVQGDVRGQGLQLFDLALPPDLNGDVRLTVTPSKVQLARVQLRGPGGATRVAVDGDVDLEGEKLALVFDAAIDQTSAVVTKLPPELKVGRTAGKGTIGGPFKAVVVDVAAVVDAINAWGTPAENVSATVKVSAKEVRVEKGTGILAGGVLSQRAPLVLAMGKSTTSFSSGTFFVRGAHLGRVRTPSGEPLPVAGVVDVEASLRGTTTNPRVPIRAAGAGIVVKDEQFGAVTAAFVATKDALTFQSVSTSSPLLKATSSLLRIDLDAMRIAGTVDIAAIDLARIQAATSAKLRGRGRGLVMVSGQLAAPTAKAELSMLGLAVAGVELGDGPVTVSIAPDPAGRDGALMAMVSSSTAWTKGAFTTRVAYAIDRDVISADIRLRDVDLSGLLKLPDAVAPLEGFVDGVVTMSGPLSAPTASFRLRVPELAAAVVDAGPEENTTRLRTMGSVFLGGHIDRGALSGRVCAFPTGEADADVDNPCGGGQRLWASLAGTVNLRDAALHLSVDGSLQEARIHELVPALGAREIELGGRTRINAAIDVPAEGETTVQLVARLLELVVRPPGAPAVALTSPVEVVWSGGRAIIGDEAARFATTRDGFDLVIAAGSSVGADDIDLTIDGQLALAALKLVTDEVANAAGTADTHLRVSGRFEDGVIIEGAIAPQPGARLTSRSLGQPLVFEAARISLRPDLTDLRRLRIALDAPCGDDRAELCPLRAQLGSGRVQVRGDVLARTSRDDRQTWVERFDLAMSATGVEVKTSLGRVEAGFDLSLQGEAPAPVLRGRLDVTDGLLKKEFQVRNFILTQAPERPSDPLWLTLSPYGLGQLVFDVTASMQNVRTKARINAFSIDASMRGDLRLSRTLKFPGIDGAIEVEGGTVDFPRARFDVIEMQLQFPTSPDGAIKPLLHLSARAELPPGSAGNSVEVPVDLSLDGGFDAMQLDLSATDPNRQWTRSELFAYILFGVIPAQPGGADLVGTSVEVASRAALRELTAPVNREVEALVESNLGVDVNIDVVSGFQVQLGRRVVLEGPGLQALVVGDSTTSASASTTNTSGTEAVRLRLLLYDHLPVGRALSWDGRFGLISDLRLSWRLYEQ
jgi:hypothetical protein